MSGENFEISRRKALAAIGTTGIAAAGAGLGTSAYFSDTEEFTGNRLTAGELDLQVDWEEHYVDMRGSEAEISGVRELGKNDSVQDGEYGFPDPQNPLLAISESKKTEFQNATSIECFPDSVNNNGIQQNFSDENVCGANSVLGSVDAKESVLDPQNDFGPNDEMHRTMNEDTVVTDDSGNVTDTRALINLSDVKPGDCGELTLSFHLCDNPGYVWLQGGVATDKNGDPLIGEGAITEPEYNDPDEDQKEGGALKSSDSDGKKTVELLDEIQTLMWYDEDGDNVYEPSGKGGKVDVMVVLDRSGSMDSDTNDDSSSKKWQNTLSGAKNLVNALGGGAEAGLVSFADSASVDQGLTSTMSDVTSSISGLSTGGGTNMEAAIDTAQSELANGRSDASSIMVILSDGEPTVGDSDTTDGTDPTDNATAARDAGTEIFTIAYGGSADTTLMESLASDTNNAYTASTNEVEKVFSNISQAVAGEKCFYRGSLRNALNLLNGYTADGATEVAGGMGIPLDGDRRDGSFTEVENMNSSDTTKPNGGESSDRQPFVDATTNAIGFAWWLPVDHANEIQGDWVEFDIGFYTEQARHNDGSGQA
ncbi:VWA domain-containing protein [Haloarchaeobius sp. HME9146]|uniref:vWA domain-containing protein n=1 Tax=Haloarchaeobius sp. HME9146 TaxID=2978732 RepID=UPI0021BF8AAE|nr:vWA domain-containing protein [Haloarchaeobius sp. HME9146]MCT9097348.1 VWA domain-containing protein [Haloarchaeobius sp. HME9146]